MGLLIGVGVNCLKDRKRYTHAMGLLIGLSVQYVLKYGKPRRWKTVYLGHVIAHRVKPHSLSLSDKMVYLVRHGIAHRVELSVRFSIKQEKGIPRPWHCASS